MLLVSEGSLSKAASALQAALWSPFVIRLLDLPLSGHNDRYVRYKYTSLGWSFQNAQERDNDANKVVGLTSTFAGNCNTDRMLAALLPISSEEESDDSPKRSSRLI